jgi:DNA-binding IclR family transcriptional regulator
MSALLALCPRRAFLLNAIRNTPGEWTTSRAWGVNRANGAPNRRTARRDLDALHRAGLLTQDGGDRRFYELTAKGATS